MKTLLASSLLLVGATAFSAKPEVIPEIREWTEAATPGFYKIDTRTAIHLVNGDMQAQTMMRVFAEEMGIAYRYAGDKTKPGEIAVGIATGPVADEAPEAYTIRVTPENIEISGNSAQGAFWATRTLLQVFIAKGKEFPCGVVRDWPEYPVRGFMFDCGRKPFTLTTLYQIVDLMSYYKLNDFQLHLSDNYIWLHNFPGIKTPEDVLKMEPCAGGFRLESNVPGLTATDIAYSKKEYTDLVTYALNRGVKIVPEIDVPGHALPMVRVRPDLMYKGSVGGKHDAERAAMLDLTNPETLPFVTGIFDEYIDSNIFSGDIVHIGTDEYYGDAESYRKFADDMLRYVLAKGKTPRLWGSFSYKKGTTPVIAEGVQMNIWNMGWQDPQEAIKMGYDIINIIDVHTYSVPSGTGSIGGYGDDINAHWMYNDWTPIGFPNTTPEKIDRSKLLGGAWAIWNDNSFLTDPGLCGRDLIVRIKTNNAVMAQKTWYNGPRPREYHKFKELLNQVGCPVDVSLPRWSQTYTVTRMEGESNDPIVLATGDETTLYAVSPVNGNVGFCREGAQYTFNYKLPAGKTTQLTFYANKQDVALFVDGQWIEGLPIRQNWPASCKFYTLPKPEKNPYIK